MTLMTLFLTEVALLLVFIWKATEFYFDGGDDNDRYA
jgi:hypothetical protein